MEISQINSNLTSVSLVSQWPDCWICSPVGEEGPKTDYTSNWVKDFESDSHGEKLFCGIMIHNTYSMDAMGLCI